jgi:hypothetical protein
MQAGEGCGQDLIVVEVTLAQFGFRLEVFHSLGDVLQRVGARVGKVMSAQLRSMSDEEHDPSSHRGSPET